MRKVAIFTEGQGDQIFVCELLLRVVSYEVALSIECLQLRAGNFQKARPNYPNPNSTVHYLIVDVGNDEKVLRNYLKTPHDVIPSDRRESRDLAESALLDLFGEIPPLASLGRNDKR